MHKLVSLLDKGKPPWEKYAVHWETLDGAYQIVEVTTQWDYELEGYFLAHCLGTKNADEFGMAHRVFSVRDKLTYPHATILLNKVGAYSPYGASSDLLTTYTMKLPAPDTGRDIAYKVLQVRGREDRVARWEYYSIVRQWFRTHGGKFPKDKPASLVHRALMNVQDPDVKYHYGYLLDESVNFFNWAHWNTPQARRLAELGLVKL